MPIPKKARSKRAATQAPPSSLLAAGRSRRSMSSDTADGARHDIEPNAPFFLVHHPRSWRIATEGLAGPTIVPDLQKRLVQPGVNGMRTRQPHEQEAATYQAALEHDVRQGFVVLYPDEEIPADCLPDGIEGEGYLREYPCRGPVSQKAGSYHTEVWSVPQPVFPGETQAYAFERATYNKWLVHLVESGRIAPPTARVRDQFELRAADRLGRLRAAPLPPDLRAERVAAQKEALTAVQGAALPVEAA